MERNSKRIQRVSEAGNTSLRNAAAKFVAARFDAKNHAAIPPKGASQIAGYSTVTVSGASSAGLDRCAYTLGKWQNSARPAALAARKQNDNDISKHFPDIERQVAARRAATNSATACNSANNAASKPSAKDHPAITTSSVASQQTIANFESYANRLDSSDKNRLERKSGLDSKPVSATSSELPTTELSTADTGYVGKERRLAADRRNYSIKTLMHCVKKPQRSAGRRKSDTSYPLLDVFDGSAMFLAVALTTLSLCDAFFTLNILARGGQEVNPFMNYMLGYGTFAFVASKMLFTAVAVVVMTGASNLLLFKRIRVRSILATLIGLYTGLIAYELLILAMA